MENVVNAPNWDYLSDTLLDSLGQRSSLTSLLRRSVGPAVVGGPGIGPVTISGTIQGEPVVQSWQGRYGMYRGRKAYEGTNHLGNVLSVVSDLKIGLESGTADTVVDFYVADVVSLSEDLATNRQQVLAVWGAVAGAAVCFAALSVWIPAAGA